ncbi:MAG: hypothetical protein Kow00117_00640 [Phototrophicales bacterium]
MLDDLPVFYASDFELHPIQSHHAIALFEIVERDRAYLRRYQNWPDTICSLNDMQNLIEASQDKQFRRRGFDMIIYYHEQIVGKIGLVYLDWRYRHAEIGYWLAESAQGHGLMTRATRLLTHYSLHVLGLSRVFIRCAAGNRRSRAIPKRLGFHFEGVMKDKIWIHGELHEDTLYSMSARRWYRRMIYHITTKQAWQHAQQQGSYTTASLTTQGFIHFSYLNQIVRVANAIYTGQDDLIILCVEPSQLDIRKEPADPTIPADHDDGELFPHLYSALPVESVMAVVALHPQADGTFTLPETLRR